MSAPIDARERRELCDLLIELGPDAQLLCAGWATVDLAAHLVLREHVRRRSDERLSRAKQKGFSALVERLRAGAPLVPWRPPKARTLLTALNTSSIMRTSGERTAWVDLPTGTTSKSWLGGQSG
jgi:hypothetical protein